MKRSLVVCLSLLWLILVNDRLLAQVRQIRCMNVFEPFNRTVEESEYQFRAVRISTVQLEVTRKTVFEVTGIIKSPDDNSIRLGQRMQVFESIPLTMTGDLVRDKEIAEARQHGSAAIMVSNTAKFSEDATVLCEADERVEAYLNATAAALKGVADDKARVLLFVPYLESECDVVASDALREVVSNGYKELSAVRDKLPREVILQKLADPNTSPFELGTYGVLTGLCGTAGDASLLETRIVMIDKEIRLGIDGVMAGYLLIRGEDGLKVLEDARFRSRTVTTTDGNQIEIPFSEVYALMQALRFIWEYEPDRISKERLRESMRLLLDRPEFSDLVIWILSDWKDWSLHDRLMLIYSDEKLAFPPNRRAIIRYLVQSSREKGEVGPDGEIVRPAHAIRADELLETLEEKDPETVAGVKRYLLPAEQ